MARRKLRVLYVGEHNLWELPDYKFEAHFHLTRLSTDQEACDHIRKQGGELHVILVDVELGSCTLTGVELSKALRGKLSKPMPDYAQSLPPLQAPIIFVAAQGSSSRERDLLVMGGNQVIKKPLDFKKLSFALASVWRDQRVAVRFATR